MTRQARDAWIRGIVALLLAWSCAPGFAHAAQALLTVEVPPAKWKAVRLKNLPKEAAIAVKVESSGSIDVILIHQDELKRFPAAVNPEFQGSMEKRLSFSVSLPRAGDYFVILDNRRNTEPRKVRVLIRAERGKKSEPVPPPPGENDGKKKETET